MPLEHRVTHLPFVAPIAAVEIAALAIAKCRKQLLSIGEQQLADGCLDAFFAVGTIHRAIERREQAITAAELDEIHFAGEIDDLRLGEQERRDGC
jgi:hypothetical protein